MRLSYVALFLLEALGAAAGLSFLHEKSPDVVQDNYIVVLKPGTDERLAAGHYDSVGNTMLKRKRPGSFFMGITQKYCLGGIFTGYSIQCDEDTIQDIQRLPFVDYIARDRHVTGQAATSLLLDYPTLAKDDTPSGYLTPHNDHLLLRDTQQSNNWGLGRISSRKPANTNYVFQKVPKTRVYILDTGIRVSHKEFAGRAIWGANFVPGAKNVDDNGHGTHVAAIVAGETVGVDSTTIPIAVKVLDANSAGTWSSIIAGVNWAVKDARDNKALYRSVLSISIGGSKYQPLDDALQAAISGGMTVVAASSNFGRDACDYSPARLPGVITVSAIDKTDTRPSWSNYGSCVDIFAPGTEILSAWKDSDAQYYVQSGTSMACPFVSGLVTYLMSREGLQGPDKIAERVKELATKGKVVDAMTGSPNLIVFNGNPADL